MAIFDMAGKECIIYSSFINSMSGDLKTNSESICYMPKGVQLKTQTLQGNRVAVRRQVYF